MSKHRKTNFRNAVTKDAKRQKTAPSTYGYLLLPKNISVFNPKPGSRVKLDFIPYKVTDSKHPDRDDEDGFAIPGSLWYKRPFKIHRNVGVKDESVVCPTTFGKKCPICEYRAKRIKEGADKEEVRALKAKDRNLYVVVPIDDKDHEEKVHIFDISQHLFQNLLNSEVEENDEYGNFPDLENGYTLKIRFSSKTIENSQPFAEASRIDFLERDEEYDESILDEVPNLDEVLKVLPYNELEKIFFEIDDVDNGEPKDPEEEEKESEEAPPTSMKRKKKRVVKEELEPEPGEEPEEVEEPPKKRMKKSAGSSKEKADNDRCPYGHKFGIDTDKFPEDCDVCDIWDECIEAKEANEEK